MKLKRIALCFTVFVLLAMASVAAAASADDAFGRGLDAATPASVGELTAKYGEPSKVWTDNGKKRMAWKLVKAVSEGDRLTVTALVGWNFQGIRIGAPLSAIPFEKLDAGGWVQIGPTGRSTTMIFRLAKSPDKAKFLMIDPDKRQTKITGICWFVDQP